MKSSYVRVMAAGFVLTALASFSACGSTDSDDDDVPAGGSGGSGGTSGSAGKGGSSGSASGGTGGMAVMPIECGSNMCDPLIFPFPGAPAVEPCCADGNACGLDSTFLSTFGPTFTEACQARDQPGALDESCPSRTVDNVGDSGFQLELPGCCRTETGTCGYMLDKIFQGTIEVGLGCVDSEPFLDGGTPQSCGSGGSGSGGAPSSGGANSAGAPGANAGAGGA